MNSSLLAALTSWLLNPVIKYEPSDRVRELESRCEALETELNRVRVLYMNECDYNMRLLDEIRANGLNIK